MHAWMRFSPASRDVNQLLGFKVMLCTNFVGIFFSDIPANLHIETWLSQVQTHRD
jgi:hypothetical protein